MANTSHPIKNAYGEKGKVVELMGIGISKKYAGKNIGYRFTEFAINNGKEKGYQFIYVFVCDARSRHLVSKCGMKSVGKVQNHK